MPIHATKQVKRAIRKGTGRRRIRKMVKNEIKRRRR